MSKTRAVQDKIASVGKIRKITSAMQIVALTRLRKTEQQTLDARPYFEKIRELLFEVKITSNFDRHPLLAERNKKTPAAIIALGSDKGLCGNFNINIINKISKLKSQYSSAQLNIIACGNKIIKTLGAMAGLKIISSYTPIDYDTLTITADTMSNMIIQEFLNNKINSLFLVYNEFKKHIIGEAKVVKLLPLEFDDSIQLPYYRNYIYEPEPHDVFDPLLKEYIFSQIHQVVLESRAAEEMARMLAMKAATDNADKMLKKLTLFYHKARQASITSELVDIIGAAEGVA